MICSSSENLFSDDADNDPTYSPNETSTSTLGTRLQVSRPNIASSSVSEDDRESEVRPRVGPSVSSRARPTGIAPRPNANVNRQVFSDSDSDLKLNANDSEWEDVTEQNPPTFEHDFNFHETPGPRHIPLNAKEPIDIFKLFFTDTLLNISVAETNRDADQTISGMAQISPRSRLRSWVAVSAVTTTEILAFIILIFNMGLNIKPTIKAYWSKTYSTIMPWFGKILTFFHMVDNAKQPKSTQL